MYPETDVPPIRIEDGDILRIMEIIPEPPSHRFSRLKEATELNDETLRQIFNLEGVDHFELLLSDGSDAELASRLLIQSFKRAREKG